MPSKKQSSNALKDSTNVSSSKSGSKPTKKAEEVTEDDWKFALLAYYRLAVKKSMSKHLEELNLTKQRKKFVTRWQNSGLKQMKEEGIPVEIASAKYDEWLLSWKDSLRNKQRDNRMKGSTTKQVHKKQQNENNGTELEREESNEVVQVDKGSDDHNKKNLVEEETEEEIENEIEQEEEEDRTEESMGAPSPEIEQEEEEDRTEESMGAPSPNSATTDGTSSFDTLFDSNSEAEDNDTQSKKTKTRKKLPPNELKALLISFFLDTNSRTLTEFMKMKQVISHKNAIFRSWKESGLKLLKEETDSLEDSLAVALLMYDGWVERKKAKQSLRNQKNAAKVKAIPKELEIFLEELIRQLALCGQGVGKKVVTHVLEEALRDWNSNGKKSFSNSTLDRYVRKYELTCKDVKNIDPVRIAQVTEENRDAFFFRLDNVVKLLHSIGEVACPWSKWAEVDAAFIDNMDEMGTDNTRHRDKMLIPKEIAHRIFQSTPEGDKTARHITLAVFSKANGMYKDVGAGIEGAPMPMIIHTKSKKAEEGATGIEKRMALFDDGDEDSEFEFDTSYQEGITEENPLGVTVRTSNSGSMTKELFLDAVFHYINSLSPAQGSNGVWTFLLLDSHVSRWHPMALYHLFKNRVFPIFFPSHLSIVVQPQDNGVIMFMHHCIEMASQTARLFKADTDIMHANRVIEKGLFLFRDGERKKLLDHGSNSTTRSYRVTGIKPRDPYSIGWRENLELFSAFNGLKLTGKEEAPFYGVRPKEKGACPPFSEDEIRLLNEAVPILARRDGDSTVLDHPRAKCYAIANDIVNTWVEKPACERTTRPRAVTAVERIALQHVDITQIISAEPVFDGSFLLESDLKTAKKEALLTCTKEKESIQIRRKQEEATEGEELEWWTAIKKKTPSDAWHVFDGYDGFAVSTQDIEDEWEINLEYDMFQNDRRLREKHWRSNRRRKNEKGTFLHQIASRIAEEERLASHKDGFDSFMNRPKEEQTFGDFMQCLGRKIEEPSEHTVTIDFEDEEKTIVIAAHGNNTSSMSKLVLGNICKSLVQCHKLSGLKKERSRRRRGKVVKTRRGSDGIVKVAQIDDQHLSDQAMLSEKEQRSKNFKIAICRRRLKSLHEFKKIKDFDKLWKDDGSIDFNASQLTNKFLAWLLKIFNVKNRAKLLRHDDMKDALQPVNITASSFEEVEQDLREELRNYDELEDFVETDVDQSFAFTTDNSIGDSEAQASDVNDTDFERGTAVTFDLPPKESDELSASRVPRPPVSTGGTSNKFVIESSDSSDSSATAPSLPPPRALERTSPVATTKPRRQPKPKQAKAVVAPRRNPRRERRPNKKYED